MKRRMEVSQHCWKFIYKHSDISIFAVCHLFYFYNFFYLPRYGKNIFTNKFSSSGIYQYFNSSVRRVNIFLERIMCEALDDHEGSASIGARLITNFRFADDIVENAKEEEAACVLVDRLDTTTTRYKMKTKVMTNNPNGFQREIKIKGQRLEEVENFKYLGAIISNEGSKPEILSRTAQTTAALSRLKIVWRDKNISLASKVKLMRTLILSTFPYACESWILTAKIKRWIQALEMRCYRRLLNISYKEMGRTRRFATESRMQLECIMIS